MKTPRDNPHAPPETTTRQTIIEVCQRVYAHGWLAATDGNASVLLDDNRIIATPTGMHKGFMSEHDLIAIDRKGRVLQGSSPPSSEIEMHLAVYDERPDIRAVLHAHPTNCIALSVAGIRLEQCMLPEVVFTFGSIPTAAYTTPTTHEVPDEVRRWVREFDALILERHGSVTIGKDLIDAYNKLERMEHVAEITFRARLLGTVQPLSCEQITKLQRVGQDLGLPARKLLNSPCDPHCMYQTATSPSDTDELDIDELVRRVKKELESI